MLTSLVGQHPGDVGEQPVAVERLDLQLHEEHAAGRRRPLDLDDPLRLREQGFGVGAVGRCTETPLPRVTKPRIASPGTGVQQRASLTHTSAMPLTTTPGSPAGGGRPGRDGAGGLGDVLAGALLAADRGDQARHDVLGGDVALADRGVQRVDVLLAQLLGDAGERLDRVSSRCSGRPCLRIALARESLPVSIISSRRSLVNHCLILLRARGELDEGQPVARRARPPSALEVSTSTTSPFRARLSSGTRRPLTRPPMQWCPTSVCTA